MIIYIDENFNIRKSNLISFLNLRKIGQYQEIYYSKEIGGFVDKKNEIIEFDEEDLDQIKKKIKGDSDRITFYISKELLIEN